MATLPNWKKSVSEITDRAKRYRANRVKKLGKFCENCGSRENLLIGHRDGNESHNAPHNLGTFCKSCNGVQAHEDKRAGRGVRTRQYNPGAINLAQYVQAAMDHVRGSHDAAGTVLHETPKAIRREFAKEIWWRRGYRGNPPEDIMPEYWAGKLRDSHGRIVHDEKKAKAILLSELRALGEIGPRRNPGDADGLYRKFHGRGPDETRTLLVSEVDPYGSHPELAQLGYLVRFIVGEGVAKMGGETGDVVTETESDDVWAAEIAFVPVPEWRRMEQKQIPPTEMRRWLRANNAPDVAAEPEAKQLFIVGGNQNIDSQLPTLGADATKEYLDLGFVYFIEYFTQKRFDRFDPVSYWHHFGEKSGVRPRLTYDRLHHRLSLVGGEYTIKPSGINN